MLAFRDEGKDSAAMDTYSRIEPAPRGQHEVCVNLGSFRQANHL